MMRDDRPFNASTGKSLLYFNNKRVISSDFVFILCSGRECNRIYSRTQRTVNPRERSLLIPYAESPLTLR